MANTRNRGGSKQPEAVALTPDAVVSSSRSLSALPSPVKSTSQVVSSSKRKRSPKQRVNEKQKRPTAVECKFVVSALGTIHPDVVEENNKRREVFITRKKKEKKKQKTDTTSYFPVTDAVINTMLSQNTTAANQNKAFARLKEAFPGGWEEVATADTSRIENAIRPAGLAATRAERMQSMLRTVKEERGEANFEYLQQYDSTDTIQKELSRFKGMGPKTISCVCLFACK